MSETLSTPVVVQALLDPENLRKRTAAWIGVIVLLVFSGLICKLFFLQILRGDEFRTRALRQASKPTPVTLVPVSNAISLEERPVRGPIVDRAGRVLARSYYEHRLCFDPSTYIPLPNAGPKRIAELDAAKDSIVRELPALLRSVGQGVAAETVAEKIERTHTESGRVIQEVLLCRDVDPATQRLLSAAIEQRRWSGFNWRHVVARVYPYGETTAQVVGIVGESQDPKDDGRVAGRMGLEWQFDQILEGRRGVTDGERDARGHEFRFDTEFQVPPTPGAAVHLTIDAEIQRFCLEALEHNAKKNPCVRSSALVLDPKTGEILASVSYPASAPEGPGFNARYMPLAVASDSYEPGSTIKPVIIGWGLEKGYIRGDQYFECGGADGREVFYNRLVEEYSVNPQALTPAQILWRSSNVGATRIGLERLKLRGLFDAFAAFHVRSRPNSGLPLETAGYHTPEKSDPEHGIRGATESGAGVSFPRGYEVRVSPLGLATIYTTFANGGERVTPTVIRDVRYGGTIVRPPPPARERILSRATVDYIRNAMLQAYENPRGTAYSTARSTRYSAMGKTGTAQYQDKYTARGAQYNAWIVGMAPAKNPDNPTTTRDPDILVIVVHHRVANRGKGTYTGGVVSGPVLKEIVERTLEYLGVEPDQPVDALPKDSPLAPRQTGEGR